MGVYRFLSNHRVTPHDLQAPHRALTRQACAALPVVLAVSDLTSLDFTGRAGIRNLGCIGIGAGRGLKPLTTLAVAPEGGVLGVLAQRWLRRDRVSKDETERERQARWRPSEVWAECAAVIGKIDGCRVIHVADREADVYGFLEACVRADVGFLVRAAQDRGIADETACLWECVQKQDLLERFEAPVSRHQSAYRNEQRAARTAKVALRTARVTRSPPPHRGDPRKKSARPLEMSVVHGVQEHPPKGDKIEPLEWMLLTSEKAESAADARRVVGWYKQRWAIEEFHRAEKEGCRLEKTQLDSAEDIERLAAMTAVIAVRLLQLRDAADAKRADADNPGALDKLVDKDMRRGLSMLTGVGAHQLTPRLALATVARRGGWLARKNDPRPGWKCLMQGWRDIALMAAGASLFAKETEKCA